MGATGRIILAYLMLFMLFHIVFSLPFSTTELAENQELIVNPQYFLLVAIIVIDLLQAIIRNTIAGKPFSQLPLGYIILKEKNFSIFTIAFAYAGLQFLVNLFVFYFSTKG
jgi:hypothetical protein